MTADGFWTAFYDTGDPLCYLCYRAMRAGEQRSQHHGD